MTYNCLKRIDSDEELSRMRMNEMQQDDNNNNNNIIPNFKLCLGVVERNLSGNLNNNGKPNFQNMRAKSNLGPPTRPKKDAALPHHRVTNSGPPTFVLDPASPRLVRSSGMRRDWSFEDLRRTITN